MKVTDEMIKAFAGGWHAADAQGTHVPGARRRAGLEAALASVPDVEPFTFAGYPENEVYVHPCGTVADVVPGASVLRTCIEAGECDCESTSPWRRIYVEKQA